MQFVNKKIAVLGLGEEGKDILAWLKQNSQDCQIKVFDKIKTVDLTGFNIVFRSPGFWRLSPMLKQAEASAAAITSATKLFFELCPCPIIGVTGTKGKGTTASLISHILNQAGQPTYLAGNIGKPMLKLLPKLKPTDRVCLELSSFQLQDLTASPHIAVLLNITSEHLDVHQNITEYRQAKANILKYQTSTDHAVINADYPITKNMAKLTKAQLHWFSGQQLKIDKTKVQLRGEHNLENIAAAVAVAKIFKLSPQIINQAVYSFKSLEHRLELVKTVNQVSFYNDSFSTTPETAIAALKSFSQPLIVILGGSDKGSDYTQLGKIINQHPHLKALILIGQMADNIQSAIDQAGGFKGKIIRRLKNMPAIVDQAVNLAQPGDLVLLSPACASFDMFKHYKDRGNQFKACVAQLE